jgi:hypothetical protein
MIAELNPVLAFNILDVFASKFVIGDNAVILVLSFE